MTSEQPAATVRTEPYAGYTSAAEHTVDELKRLDLLIYHQMLLGGQSIQNESLSAFRGLVITDEEVKRLLEPQPPDTLSRKASHLLAEIKALDDAIQRKCAAALQAGIYLPLARLAGIFRLSPLEQQCLLICLAQEIDSKYERLYAYLQNDITRKKPTVDLVLNLLCHTPEERLAARKIFQPGRPLPTYLLHLKKSDSYGELSLLSASLTLDERIVSYLLRDDGIDTRIRRWGRLFWPGAAGPRVAFSAEDIDALEAFCRLGPGEAAGRPAPQAVYLYGPTGAGRSCRVEVMGERLQAPVLFVDVPLALSAGRPLEEVLRLVMREAILRQAVLCFQDFDALLEPPESRRQNLRVFEEEVFAASILVFLTGGGAAKNNVFSEGCRYVSVEIALPDFQARKLLWAEMAREHTIEAEVDLDELPGSSLLPARLKTPWQQPVQRRGCAVPAGLRLRWTICMRPAVGKANRSWGPWPESALRCLDGAI